MCLPPTNDNELVRVEDNQAMGAEDANALDPIVIVVDDPMILLPRTEIEYRRAYYQRWFDREHLPGEPRVILEDIRPNDDGTWTLVIEFADDYEDESDNEDMDDDENSTDDENGEDNDEDGGDDYMAHELVLM